MKKAVAAVILAVSAHAVLAAPSRDPFADAAESNGIAIVAQKPRYEAAVTPPLGNPLWAVPLSALSVTRERPLFSPTRRPIHLAVPAPVAAAPKPMAPLAPQPLTLSLIGAVVGDDDAVAVFVDRATQGIVRLRAGQTHAGWSLTAIEARAATLTRGAQSEIVVIPRNDATIPAVAPRATPKTGESDGL